MIGFWCLAGAGIIALLIAAVGRKKEAVCQGYDIRIHGANEQLFLDKSDILELLTNSRNIKGTPIAQLDLKSMEAKLRKHEWISDVEMFVDNNNMLRIKVNEREPIARVFTVGGNSFYIDTACYQLPLTDKIAVRLPVFTGFPAEGKKLSKADKLLMQQLRDISRYVNKDAFWNAQVSQIDITSQRTFEIIPTIGNHVIELGDGTNVESKFNRLMVFYKQVLSKAGLSAYAKINVQFDKQVIGKRSEVRISRYDSLMAVKKLQQLIIAAQRMQPDTLRMNTRPLETGTMNEQQLRNYDLIADTTNKQY